MKDAPKQLRGVRGNRPLLERMARTIINNESGEYSAAEVERVREALEFRPDTLAEVLGEVFKARDRKGGDE